MINYIKADLYRLMRRVPRILLVAASYAILIAMVLYRYFTNWSAFQFCDAATLFIQHLAPAILGVVELSAVYADDFRAKTMQVAIGIGVSRPMVVLAKLLEFAIVMLLDLLVALALTLLGSVALGAGLVGEQYGDLMISLVMAMLHAVCYASLAMIPMFFTQSTNLGTLLYLLCVIPLFPWLLSSLVTFGPLAPYRLDNYLVFNQMDQFGAYLMTHTFNLGVTAGIVFYFLLFYVVTVLVFRKRELEF